MLRNKRNSLNRQRHREIAKAKHERKRQTARSARSLETSASGNHHKKANINIALPVWADYSLKRMGL